jgi:FkbM family methyltransferase
MRALLCVGAVLADPITDVYKHILNRSISAQLSDEEINVRFDAATRQVPSLSGHLEDGDRVYRLADSETYATTGAFHFLRKGKHGVFALFPYDMFVSGSMFLHGVWSEPQVEFLQNLVPKGATVVDVGANIGSITVPLAQMVGQGGTVHAFEPFRRIFQLLTANVALNGLNNVYTYPVALSNETKQRGVPAYNFDAVGNYGASNVEDGTWLERTNDVEELRFATLDSFGLGEVFLIKIDVEQHERQVLEGSAGTIQKYRPIIMIETNSEQVVLMLKNWGYKCSIAKTEPYGSGVYRNEGSSEVMPVEYDNLFCIHESTA